MIRLAILIVCCIAFRAGSLVNRSGHPHGAPRRMAHWIAFGRTGRKQTIFVHRS